MTGRPLEETFAQAGAELPTLEEAHETATGGYRQGLLRLRVGNTAYLDHGWAEGG
jgi:hypothetical protein